MDYFPIFVAVKSRKLLFVGGSMDIVHKVRLVMKSTADMHVFSPDEIAPNLKTWADQGKIIIHHRQMTADDSKNAVFAFIDGDDGPRRDHAMAVGFDDIALPSDLAERYGAEAWRDVAAFKLPDYQSRLQAKV